MGLLHFGGRDQLHRLGDLRGVLNRLDASADVAEIGHFKKGSGNRIQEAESNLLPGTFEVFEGGIETFVDVVGECFLVGDFLKEVRLAGGEEFL